VEASGIIIDTDVLVSDLRGRTSVLRDLEDGELATTVVNAFELFHGAYKSKEPATNLSATRGLLASLEVVGLGVKAAERAGEVLAQVQKSGTALDIRDLLVGCIAREEGFSLLTYNVRHFLRIPGLEVIDAAQRADLQT
jgi:predicted nucleic acid-binding protein